jgi:hypothetical protein
MAPAKLVQVNMRSNRQVVASSAGLFLVPLLMLLHLSWLLPMILLSRLLAP